MKNLSHFFEPSSVAIIGASATPKKSGHEVVRNILANGYTGRLYLVNPKGGEILGMSVYPSIASLPEVVDLAIIIIPAQSTPEALRECAAKGIKAAVLSAGGFAELNREGEELQNDLIRTVAETGIRVLGPNTAGHTSTPHNFTSSFVPLGRIPRGHISYITQTGNFCSHTMKYLISEESFGVARVIGIGNKIDIDESEALEYLGEDPETKGIFMYVESINRPERFVEVAGEVTRIKPVILLKGGSTSVGARAAVFHTAAPTVDDLTIDMMLKQAGVVRIYEYSHLFLAAKALAYMPLPQGNRVSILAPSGALLVILTDLCYAKWGLTVPEVEEATRQRLQSISPPYIPMRNPVDIWAAALVHGVEYGYGQGIEAVMEDPNIDAVVPILMLSDDTGAPPLDFLVDLVTRYPEKVLYVTFSAEKKHMEAAKAFLEPRGIPTFSLMEEPFEVLSILYRCREAMERAQ